MTRNALMQLRPLITIPTWDGKIVLAGLLIIGYYALVLLVVGATPAGDLTPVRAGVVHDALLTLGPPIGLVFGALFRSTGAEERAQALRSADLQTAITTPSITGTGDGEAAIRRGAEEGSRAGVADGIGEAVGTAPSSRPSGRPPGGDASTEIIV